MGLLGVSRQGSGGKRLPLSDPRHRPRPLITRLLWFVALWLGGVGTVALISYILRLWIAPHR